MIDKTAIAANAKALSSEELMDEIIFTAARREREEILSEAWLDRSAVLSIATKEMLSRIA